MSMLYERGLIAMQSSFPSHNIRTNRIPILGIPNHRIFKFRAIGLSAAHGHLDF